MGIVEDLPSTFGNSEVTVYMPVIYMLTAKVANFQTKTVKMGMTRVAWRQIRNL